MNSLQYWHVPISEYYAVTGSTHLTLVICHSLFVFAVYLITWWGDKYPVRKSCGIERRRKARQDRSIFAADAKESPVISETIFPIIYISISASVVCSFCLFDCSHTTQANCRLLSILEPDSLFIYCFVCFQLKGFFLIFPVQRIVFLFWGVLYEKWPRLVFRTIYLIGLPIAYFTITEEKIPKTQNQNVKKFKKEIF